jgi:hypothetical protein
MTRMEIALGNVFMLVRLKIDKSITDGEGPTNITIKEIFDGSPPRRGSDLTQSIL